MVLTGLRDGLSEKIIIGKWSDILDVRIMLIKDSCEMFVMAWSIRVAERLVQRVGLVMVCR